MKVTQGNIAWLAVAGFAILLMGFLIAAVIGRTRPAAIFITPPVPTATPPATETPGPVRIFVSGEVSHPAVYELPANEIVEDAVRAAGGFTEKANRNVVNLALPLIDGMHVHVPSTEENVSAPVLSNGQLSTSGSGGGPIDINKATLEELDKLPGIGPVTAQSIIDYRQSNGPFADVSELINVSGIGPVRFEQIRELVIVN